MNKGLVLGILRVAQGAAPGEIGLGRQRIDAGQETLPRTESAWKATRTAHQRVRDRIGEVLRVAPPTNGRESMVGQSERGVDRERALEVRLRRVPACRTIELLALQIRFERG